MAETTGKLEGLEYEQLMPYVNPGDNAFRVIIGDYVTTSDGTESSTLRLPLVQTISGWLKRRGSPLILIDKEGNSHPMVDKTGKYFEIDQLDPQFVKDCVNVELYKTVAGRYVKPEYERGASSEEESLDLYLALWLKMEGKAFKIEKYLHNYPHCWRTDMPILYYPLDSWFIKTTAYRERMMELNATINWKPAATGSGRFGNWLENLVDWNLSRSRFWGIPLPIWVTEDKKNKSVSDPSNSYTKRLKNR